MTKMRKGRMEAALIFAAVSALFAQQAMSNALSSLSIDYEVGQMAAAGSFTFGAVLVGLLAVINAMPQPIADSQKKEEKKAEPDEVAK
jgi:hypothetical protein